VKKGDVQSRWQERVITAMALSRLEIMLTRTKGRPAGDVAGRA
jgi:hypothetical protein